MDLKKLTLGDKLIGGGAIVFLIAFFLPWYELSVEGVTGGLGSASDSASGADYGLFGVIPLLLIIAVAVLALLPVLNPSTTLPKPGGLTWGQILLGLSAVALLLVLLRLVITDDGDVPASVQEFVDITRGIGLFLAFLAAAVVTAGAFLKYQSKDTPTGATGTGPASPF